MVGGGEELPFGEEGAKEGGEGGCLERDVFREEGAPLAGRQKGACLVLHEQIEEEEEEGDDGHLPAVGKD